MSAGGSSAKADPIARWKGIGGQTRMFAFYDKEKIGPRMLSRLSRQTGLQPQNL